jgi:hypothetical protein
MTTSNEVECCFTILDSECFFDTWSQHFKQVRIVLVETDVSEDISVGNDTESSEDDDDRDGNLDIR